ncbi:ATP-binding protein [Caenispirillum salinarum]|uniref:ATP-binding protein n=1 Tax=Caenispirillum salinarum TaxID=859058 RepID=UPI00384E8A83
MGAASITERRTTLVVLIAGSVLLLAAVVTIFIILVQRQGQVEQSVREDALWAVYQVDREMTRLRLAFMAAQREGLDPREDDASRLRFDIMVSRVSYMQSGQFSQSFGDCDRCVALLREIEAGISPLIAWFDQDPGTAGTAIADLSSAVDHLATLNEMAAELLALSNGVRAKALVETREETVDLYWSLAAAVVVLAAAVTSIIWLLLMQIREKALAHASLRALSEELKVTAETAEAANAAKSRFLAVVSHELRTPLTGIIGLADLLDTADLPPEAARQVRMLRHSGRTLLSVVNDVLDYSRVEADEMRIESSTFSIRDVAGTIAEIADETAAVRGIRVSLAIDADVPDCLIGDGDRIRQVLLNLVNNAIKFTDTGTVTVTVAWTGDCAGRRLFCSVEDEGPGIPAALAERLFQPFVQGDDTARRRHGGTGLGLAICHRLVRAMDGEIGFDRTRRVGARFWFSLPSRPAPECVEEGRGDNRAEASAASIRGSVTADAPALRVLLAEDNDTTRMLLDTVLRRWGHDVTTASNGADAVDLVQQDCFDVVLMDIQMPVMDGPDACRRIRMLPDEKGRLPIIILSADALTGEKEAAAAGADTFLTKPVDWTRLRETLSSAVGAPSRNRSTVSPAHPAVPVFDAAPLDAFAAHLDPLDLASLIDDLERKLGTLQADLQDAARRGQDEDVRRVGHSLKGMCRQFGLEKLAALGAEIQAAENSTALATDLSETLHDLAAQSVVALRAWSSGENRSLRHAT